MIKFNQNAWLKSYVDMNTDLRKKQKMTLKKDFFKSRKNAVFGKTMENVRKHRDIKLVTTERRRNYLVLEPNYQTTKFFTEHLLAIDTKKTEILMDKPVYLGPPIILQLSKMLMFEFWYNYLKRKYDEKAKLFHMDTDSFIVYTETDDITKILQKMLKEDLTLQIMN